MRLHPHCSGGRVAMPASLTKGLGLAASAQSWALDLAPKLRGPCSLPLAVSGPLPHLAPHFTLGPPTHLAGLRGLGEGAAACDVSSS